ncbi:RNA polymerase sigma factor [Mangrovibacterium lignilyticum]|uniref:RNA polymerase sigma factor n=1 Tax=Mangrovibacterium lignilyticum TaxID=2668052 RepID=UPI0013D8481D|nr:RNA polymerase sigma-70 factor [Mangrovibacterium lignilyticum]
MHKLELNTEKELVTRFISGDQLAFELLFHRYKNKLNGFVMKLAPSQIDPDEVVQKVFIKVWIQRDKVKPEKSFSSFLFTIAKHELVDQLRNAINRKLYFVGDEAISDLLISDSTAETAKIELEEKVTGLIEKLPDRRRQIFEMSRYNGLTYRQIAEELGISENTVDTQIRLALNFIRKEVTKVKVILLAIFSK